MKKQIVPLNSLIISNSITTGALAGELTSKLATGNNGAAEIDLKRDYHTHTHTYETQNDPSVK